MHNYYICISNHHNSYTMATEKERLQEIAKLKMQLEQSQRTVQALQQMNHAHHQHLFRVRQRIREAAKGLCGFLCRKAVDAIADMIDSFMEARGGWKIDIINKPAEEETGNE